ncbi:DUF2634 domain-containing protein [Lachnospiraceae bacterium 46-61]
MLPQNNEILNNGIEISTLPTKTHYINKNENLITGMTDGIEALKQAIYIILRVERYQHIIYSWNYGIELKDLFGKPTTYVCAVLPSRIKDALIQDDRIQNVCDIVTSAEGNTVSIHFTVQSIYGEFEQEVQYIV